jgi:hypothetical protein
MKLAIMQPYFFPYIGYWQLITAADKFVLFDDAQYIRHGWISRNRILKPTGGWQYIIVPLQKHNVKEKIKNVLAHPENKWKDQIVAQLSHYKKKAGYFDETIQLLHESFSELTENSIATINFSLIKRVCKHLCIDKEIIMSSVLHFDYSNVADAGEWALRMAEQLDATEYINPIGGADLFEVEKFASSNIKLSFLKSNEIRYLQRETFEPALSIIDVLMFNGKVNTRDFLNQYSIESTI